MSLFGTQPYDITIDFSGPSPEEELGIVGQRAADVALTHAIEAALVAGRAAPATVSSTDVANYIGGIDPGIQQLQHDVRNQLVTMTSDDIDSQISDYQSMIDKAKGTFYETATYNIYQPKIDDLKKQKDILSSRMKGKSPDQVNAEIQFSQEWFNWYHNYTQKANELLNATSLPAGQGSSWDWVASQDDQYHTYLNRFASIGGTTHSPDVTFKGTPSAVNWNSVLIAGGIVIVALFTIRMLLSPVPRMVTP